MQQPTAQSPSMATTNGIAATDGSPSKLIPASRNSVVITLLDNSRITIHAYRYNRLKVALTYLLTALTLGLFRLVMYWKPSWCADVMADVCTLADANVLLVRDENHEESIRPVRTQTRTNTTTSLPIPTEGGDFESVDHFRYFTFRKLKFIWHSSYGEFLPAYHLDHEVPIAKYQMWAKGDVGLTEEETIRRRIVYGLNLIVVNVKPIWLLLFKEVISPFYVFQIFSVTVWYNDEYEYYATVIVLISLFSISLDVYQIRTQEKALRDMVHSTDVVQCVRDGVVRSLPSELLVPGDLIHIAKHGATMQCDAVLLSGSCIVNESMLTGESVPVTKTALPEVDDASEHIPIYTQKEHAKHTLYCGTQILQTRFYGGQAVKAIVLRTGFSTSKGQLVRSIMYPKPVDFQFTKDLFRFVGVLAIMASIGFVYAIIIMIHRNQSVKEIILRSLDIITIVVPPALPAAMTIGILAAQNRLKKKKIFCISPSTINTCGAINLVCFDKTGTLTEDGLDFHCAVAVIDTAGAAGDSNRGRCFFGDEMNAIDDMTAVGRSGAMVKAVASCHGLTKIDGKLDGDPLDLILFAETKWNLDEPQVVEETSRFDTMIPTVVRSPLDSSGAAVELGIIRQFPFSSHLQRQSVLVRQLDGDTLTLYCKGAPEKIASLCLPDTLPKNYDSLVNRYAKRGFRLIAAAQRQIKLNFVKAQRVPREQVELELEFLGLLIMENRLKTQTVPVIRELNAANIRSVMVTGDNILTAMSVALECRILSPKRVLYVLELESGSLQLRRVKLGGDATNDDSWDTSVSDSSFTIDSPSGANNNDVVDVGGVSLEMGLLSMCHYQIAMAGPTFAYLHERYPADVLEKLAAVTGVFARMSPDQKSQLISICQSIDYTVAMCGDGANDCGALKAAHAGISLSEAEASIASPFTSQVADIRCVPTVVKEGRGALVTSYAVIKYMAGYSMTQFATVSLLYWLATNLGDFQFLYVDLFLITTLALLFGYTDPADRLCPQPPPLRILTVSAVVSIVSQLLIVITFQLLVFLLIPAQPWFSPTPPSGEGDVVPTYEGTGAFLISIFQYVTLALVYCKGRPYRKSLFNNLALCVAVLVATVANLVVTLVPPPFLADFLTLKPPESMLFRLLLVVFAAINAVLCYLVEMALVDYLLDQVAMRKRWPCVATARGRYFVLRRQLGVSVDWLKRAIDDRRAIVGATVETTIDQSPTTNVLHVAENSTPVR